MTVIDRRNYHLFHPLFYQVATAGLSPADIASPIRSILSRYKNTRVVLADFTGIRVDEKTVIAEDRHIPYDILIVATGALHAYLGHDEWAEYAPGLKRVDDATYLRRRILVAFERADAEPDIDKQRGLLNFVVVGGGPTGVEMAGAIAELARKAVAVDFRKVDPRDARVILVQGLPALFILGSALIYLLGAMLAPETRGLIPETHLPESEVAAFTCLVTDTSHARS